MVMSALESGLAAGAADKWRVLQLFHEGFPKNQVRAECIDRVACSERYRCLLEEMSIASPDDLEIGFFVPSSTAQLQRFREGKDLFADVLEEDPDHPVSVPIALHPAVAFQRGEELRAQKMNGGGRHGYACVVLCAPGTLRTAQGSTEYMAGKADLRRLMAAYVICYQHIKSSRPTGQGTAAGETSAPRRLSMRTTRAESPREQHARKGEYAKVRDPFIKAALLNLEDAEPGTATASMLAPGSDEAEAAIALYLLSGGGLRLQLPPGVDAREALGSVVVLRIVNEPLFREYCVQSTGQLQTAQPGELRYREDTVWHGTRLKKTGGEEASLAMKLQSIAANGFDPRRCMKGATSAGGIWVSSSPLISFGSSDGLVAFVLCLAKTNFNEWVDASCARVLARERVLPLYALVHIN